MDQAVDLKYLKYIANDYIIYKNGKAITGHCYGYWREVRIRKKREEKKLYDVTIYKLDRNRQVRGTLLPTLPMEMVQQNNCQIQLRNRKNELILHLHNNAVEEIIWRRYDQCAETVFIKAPAKGLEHAINIPLCLHLAELKTSANKTNRNGLIKCYHTIVKEMELHGQATRAKAHYYFFFGKALLEEGAYREAKEAFTLCNTTLLFNNIPANHEAIYWFGKVNEVEGHLTEATICYGLALKNYTGNTGEISREEIIQALNAIQTHPSKNLVRMIH